MFGVFVVVQHFSKLKKPEQFTSYLQALFLKLKISDKDMLQLSKQEDSSAPSRLPRVSRCWDLTRNLVRILEKNGQPIQCCPTWKLVVQHWWGDIRLARSRSYGCLELRINLSHSRIGRTCWMVTRLQCLHGQTFHVNTFRRKMYRNYTSLQLTQYVYVYICTFTYIHCFQFCVLQISMKISWLASFMLTSFFQEAALRPWVTLLVIWRCPKLNLQFSDKPQRAAKRLYSL